MSVCTWLPEWHLSSRKWVVQGKKQDRSHNIINNLALKVTSYHSAISYWSHRIIWMHCGKGLYKGADSRRWEWLGLPCWLATTCPRINHHLMRNKSHWTKYLSFHSLVRQFWVLSFKVFQTVPGGMKSLLLQVVKQLDFLCSYSLTRLPGIIYQKATGSQILDSEAQSKTVTKNQMGKWAQASCFLGQCS